MAESLTYTYTSQNEIERILSNSGVQLRIRDLNGTNSSDYWAELIAEATDVVNQWVDGFYDYDDLADNQWVRRHATWIALTLLCRRRANPVPDSILERYEEVLEDLRNVKMGVIQIPRLPTRSDMTPAMSNLRVDDRYYSRKLRVNPSISAGGTSGDQDLDWWWSYDWF